MKKIVLISLALITFSCSKELQEKTSALKVSPPGWLHGSWTTKDTSSGNPGWNFTPDAAAQIDGEGNALNILSVYFIMIGFEDITVDEFENSNNYSIEIKGETFSKSYRFSRISDQEMSWDNAPPVNGPELYLKSN